MANKKKAEIPKAASGSVVRDMSDDPQAENYMVVARRYRPQTFIDLVGQEQVAKALRNAIERDRVGHAYLFTGARGVGKTSTARIFAKCLNCVHGPTDSPCGQCDLCQAVAQGEDVDVLEIDGASNRGIDEIRQLRANVSVRPSRARYKIYIIDEVHMLTKEAFNALLKTLEEPPAHVKFFFCTTDPEKIPITVRSRCQRFDLPPISTAQIRDRLRHIAQQDAVDIDDDALDILARRANGSMRDSQSLLEQLFAFCGNKIRSADVHALLGTADSAMVLQILKACVNRDAHSALQRIAEAIDGGVDAGQLDEQLLNLYRDMMALRVGCGEQQVLHCHSADIAEMRELVKLTSLEQILAAIEILDNSLIRMKHSAHLRTLLEAAVLRICSLPELQQIANLIEQLRLGGGAASVRPSASVVKESVSKPTPTTPAAADSAKKKTDLNDPSEQAELDIRRAEPPRSVPPAQIENDASNSLHEVSNQGSPRGSALLELTDDTCEYVWQSVLQQIDDMTSDIASMYESFRLEEHRLVVMMKDVYHRDACQRNERKQRLERALSQVVGKHVVLDFQALSQPTVAAATVKSKETRIQKIRRYEKHPFVQQALELFEGEIADVIQSPDN
ncbi:MAG TPA: DNA polymerase III subunit gamma/tau [Pirellulaceae bacterium]|nr:DNA polymerase III subunit gamma/tau [Pirellulaceae bacterium]HMO93055.1 DNA polymerase III subunit gamma/tau [Pirellulaceae bacterium]HMP69685.1 DNA polymerase III subunit gamma/tau [Pirellulaceae bacterium]